MGFKPVTLRVYLQRALEMGLSPHEILHGSGTSWADIEALRPMDLDQIAGLFDCLARRTPRDFAIQCGLACKIRDFGIVGFSMMSMPTLRDAFEYLNRYCRLVGHPLINTMSESGDKWCMQFVPCRIMSAEALRFCQEISIAALGPVIEELTDAPASTHRIDFSFARPAETALYDALDASHIRYGQEQPAYHGLRADLDRPIRSYDGDVSHVCIEQCDKSLAVLTGERSVIEQLEDLMLMSSGGMPSLEEMAVSLGTSCRSLQRELHLHGLNYQQLVRNFRLKRAKVLLREDLNNVKTIAHLLGFKDAGSFRRAFHGWTGLSIGEWQASQAMDADGWRRLPGAPESRLQVA
ncbi:AraC family transcriptional regulator [Novosphingobium beihaiensis]|uniref:AraC family transcriptional regulator n=1 Tax=Novosphingobium beihaiensis TaxID=2930389 RepID=A0ABT0BVU8_9SPHN|nr:AraC family transcriptional regulator [Novosphingobium beihaiensis]MCJ2189105.1 AraC family transcriptional regulator [Novosphingobium beihaiensis]